MYKIVYTKDSIKDIEKLKGANLNKKVLALIEIIKNNPFQTPPPYEKLVGDLQGLYSKNKYKTQISVSDPRKCSNCKNNKYVDTLRENIKKICLTE